MINAVAAMRTYLLSVGEISTAVTQTITGGTRKHIYGIPPGIPATAFVEGSPLPTIALQQIRVVHDPFSPRERYRIRVRTYGSSSVASSDLMRLVHNKAMITEEGFPVRNKLIDNKYFLFGIDPTDEGPIVLNEEVRMGSTPTSFPVTVSSYDCIFDGSRG